MAEIAGVSEQTARNYSRVYAELFSLQARGETGPRLFNDTDIQIFCSIATLRRENIPPQEVIERIKRGDVYIDNTTPQQTTPSAPQATQTALEATQGSIAVYSDMQRRIEAIERHQHVLLRAAVLWGALWGAVAALAVATFVLWAIWLFA